MTGRDNAPSRRRRGGGLDDAILSDLRDFARDIGLGGTAAMTKAEIVEGLRQHYLLQKLLRDRRSRGPIRT
jgi:hypothetical protein